MKNRFFIFTISIVIILNLFNHTAIANDTALSAIGDNVGPFSGTPDVIMESETINLNIYNNKTTVEVTFYLKNEGKTETILVGFPDEYASGGIKGQEDFEIANIVGPINNFKCWVNGIEQNVSQKNEMVKRIDFNGNERDYKLLWHTWPVTFDQGKTTIIKNTYQVENGSNVLGEKNFHYTLVTGAKWKGKIGKALITATFKNNLNTNDINKDSTTKGIKVLSPQKAYWELINFEPSAENETGYFMITFKKNWIPIIKSRLLTEEDLKDLSEWDLKVLRNEIYARHGRPFKSESLKSYFGSFDWYKESPSFSDKMLNQFEKQNAQIILNYEKKIGSKLINKDSW
ncbi:MAG: YARHG domain-containing protein [Cyanobacteriota bacterium]